MTTLKYQLENKAWLVDPSNPPLFVLATNQIDGHNSSDLREASLRYASFIASNLEHIYLPSTLNDVLSGKIVCQASKILTPHFQLSDSNLHSYRLKGIDLVSLIANKLSISVKQSTNCELELVDNVINLLRRPSGIQVVNKTLKYQFDKQKQIGSKYELFKKLREHGDIASKYSPPLSTFNFLVKHKLQIQVPLSLSFTSKLPIIYKEISFALPATQQLLNNCIVLLAKKELLKNSFNVFKNIKFTIQNSIPETKATPPLFYVCLSKCSEFSKVGFQESMTTKRPFQGGNTNVAVFRLVDDANQASIYFESAMKKNLSDLGIMSVKKNSDHYRCSYNFLLLAVFNILNSDQKLSSLVEELYLTNSFQLQEYLPLHNEFQSLQQLDKEVDEHQFNLDNPIRSGPNQLNKEIDLTTLNWLISLVKSYSSQFGLEVIIQKRS